jgi:hypothetical protein
MLHLRLAVLPALAALAIGCLDGTLPPVTSLAEPSNPAAPEAPFSLPPRTLAASALPPSAASAAPPADAVYVCPMHANVVQDAPGACPICGMALIPRPKAEPGHDHQGHQGHGGAK